MSYVDYYKKMKDNDNIKKVKPLDLERTMNTDKSKFYILHEDCGCMIYDFNNFKFQVTAICQRKP